MSKHKATRELTPDVAAKLAITFGYVTSGQASDIQSAAELYQKGAEIRDAVAAVNFENGVKRYFKEPTK